MKVIVITGTATGVEPIAITKDTKAAIKYLIENKLIEKNRYLIKHMTSITEKFGENWKDTILNISINKFNDFFGRYIYLYEVEVYE